MRLVLLAAVVVLAIGCGGAENDPNLAAAIEKTEAAGSSHIAIDAIEIEDGHKAVIECVGQADYERERLEISCDYGGESIEMISIPPDVYVRGAVFGLARGGSKWTKFPDDEAIASELAPQPLLAMLRAASQNTRRVGDERIRGVDTVRYRLEVNCERAELFDCEGMTAPVEVWVAEDGLVRRVDVEERDASGTIEFYDFGVEVAIEPPPADQVEDLGALLGPRECASEFGRPVRVTTALDSMRRQGFTIRDEAECTGSLAAFDNLDAAGAFEREGQLHCLLLESPAAGAPTRVRRRGVDGADAELELHNLTCTILADSPTGEEKIDKLEAAFAELERTTRP